MRPISHVFQGAGSSTRTTRSPQMRDSYLDGSTLALCLRKSTYQPLRTLISNLWVISYLIKDLQVAEEQDKSWAVYHTLVKKSRDYSCNLWFWAVVCYSKTYSAFSLCPVSTNTNGWEASSIKSPWVQWQTELCSFIYWSLPLCRKTVISLGHKLKSKRCLECSNCLYFLIHH